VPRTYVPFETTDKEEATMLVVRAAGPAAKIIYLVPPLYFPLEETLSYFSPGTRVVHGFPPSGEHQPGNYIISFIGKDPYIGENPYAQFTDHPIRYAHPRPYLRLSAE
jgi:hypothetical protein